VRASLSIGDRNVGQAAYTFTIVNHRFVCFMAITNCAKHAAVTVVCVFAKAHIRTEHKLRSSIAPRQRAQTSDNGGICSVCHRTGRILVLDYTEKHHTSKTFANERREVIDEPFEIAVWPSAPLHVGRKPSYRSVLSLVGDKQGVNQG
jgi:hypothetical protein